MPSVSSGLKPLYLKCDTLHAFVYTCALEVLNTGRKSIFEFNVKAKSQPSIKTKQSLAFTAIKQHCASFFEDVIVYICEILSNEY